MELPRPMPGPGELLVRTQFAGVNHVDWQIREGWFREASGYPFPFVPGWDLCGVIEEIGPDTQGEFAVDDLIYAYCRGETHLTANGAYAEYVALPASSCGRAPRDVAPERLAVLPVVVLTAMQMIGAAAPRPGDVALVVGANGSVGRQVLSGLSRAGVSAVAAARPHHHAELLETVAHHVVDPSEVELLADVVLDCGAGLDVAAVARMLRPGGHFVSVVRPPDAVEAERAGIHGSHVFSRPDGAGLTAIAALIEQGLVPVPNAVDVVDLDDAAIAQEKLKAGHARRISLRPAV